MESYIGEPYDYYDELAVGDSSDIREKFISSAKRFMGCDNIRAVFEWERIYRIRKDSRRRMRETEV